MSAAEPHPLGLRALELLTHGQDERYVYIPAAQETLCRELSALFEAPELLEAVEALVTVAFFLDQHRGCPSAARVLLDVANLAVEPLTRMQRPGAAQAVERLRQGSAMLAKGLKSNATPDGLATPKRANTGVGLRPPPKPPTRR